MVRVYQNIPVEDYYYHVIKVVYNESMMFGTKPPNFKVQASRTWEAHLLVTTVVRWRCHSKDSIQMNWMAPRVSYELTLIVGVFLERRAVPRAS
jgi:hypothetical protein